MLDGPFGAALPLRLHDCIDRIYNRDRNRMTGGDQVSCLLVIALLLIDEVHYIFQFIDIHHLAGLHLQPADKFLELFHRQIQTVCIIHLFPAVRCQFIPVERCCAGDSVLDDIEVCAVVFGQQAEDLALHVAGQACDRDRGCRKAAPGSHRVAVSVDFLVIRVKALRQSLRVIAVEVGAVAVFLHEAEILARHSLGAADRCPPLVYYKGNIHRAEDFHGDIRVENGKVSAFSLHALLHAEKPLFLIDTGRFSGFEFLDNC